jgi:hypothetical protein
MRYEDSNAEGVSNRSQYLILDTSGNGVPDTRWRERSERYRLRRSLPMEARVEVRPCFRPRA